MEVAIWICALKGFLVVVYETVSFQSVKGICLLTTICTGAVVELVAVFSFHVDVQY